MILAAGLSPAWQHVLRFEKFLPGEVNRAVEARWYGSGKVLNVGYALHRLGGLTKIIAPLGGLARDSIETEFDDEDLATRWIRTEAPTRICTTILDSSTGQTTELVENAEPLTASELAEFQREYAVDAVKSRYVILSGSLPAGTPTTYYRDLLRQTACPALLDARGPELLAALAERPLVVKPNREELTATFDRALDDDPSVWGAMHELNERGAEWVVVTDSAQPVWVTGPQGMYRFWPAPIEQVVNPIGSGDSLAAGIAWALRDGRPMLEAIRFGLGCAAENVGQLLAGRITLAGAEQLAMRVRMEAIV